MSKEALSGSLSPARYAATPSRSGPVALSATAWFAQHLLPVGDWVDQGRWLGAVSRASGWWIGDWIRYGNRRYGEKYDEAARITGYDRQSLMNMAYVAGQFEPARRRESLSFSHHAELAALSLEDQELWLDRVEAGGLSVRAVRFELAEARRRAGLRSVRKTGSAADLRGRPLSAAPALGAPRPSVSKHRPESELQCPHCGRRFKPDQH